MPAFGMVYANRGSLLTASEGEPGGPDLAGGAFVPDPAAGAAALAEPVLPPRLGPASRSRLQRSSCGREGGFRRLREGPRGRVRGAASPRCPACRKEMLSLLDPSVAFGLSVESESVMRALETGDLDITVG
ncbi:hypothetical protein JEQ12_006702 [Ovis aries]|uniref:Uncharacterized protein n=1 Tax=Ovis aries TaxID=9940 RepID=A0A836A086_SHEEP|nr:hypothetical protein JEQ12_006702 [Ovis aries]